MMPETSSHSSTLMMAIMFLAFIAILAAKASTRGGYRRRNNPWNNRPASQRGLPQALQSKEPSTRNMDGDPLPERSISQKPLLSEWETATLRNLDRILPFGLRACPQARLLDMLLITNNSRSIQLTTTNRLSNKSVDFAIINNRGEVKLVIELNDRTHLREDRQLRDKLVLDALRQAGIPLAVFKPGQPIDLSPWLARYQEQ